MNYTRRVKLGETAVRYGEYVTGILMYTLWLLAGMVTTYTACYNRPGTALHILNTALPLLGDSTPLNQADINLSLAKTHALNGDKKNALDYLVQAQTAMPEHPELDPLHTIDRARTS